MYNQLQQPIKDQPERVVLTPMIGVKDEHIRMTRRVNTKAGWGGEVIASLDPQEHRVMCECVALRLIEINENGLFVLAPLGAGFLDDHGDKVVHFFSENGNIVEIEGIDIDFMVAAAYTEDGVHGIGSKAEQQILSNIQKAGLIELRNNEDGTVDYYLTKAGTNFLIDEGYLLG